MGKRSRITVLAACAASCLAVGCSATGDGPEPTVVKAIAPIGTSRPIEPPPELDSHREAVTASFNAADFFMGAYTLWAVSGYTDGDQRKLAESWLDSPGAIDSSIKDAMEGYLGDEIGSGLPERHSQQIMSWEPETIAPSQLLTGIEWEFCSTRSSSTAQGATRPETPCVLIALTSSDGKEWTIKSIIPGRTPTP